MPLDFLHKGFELVLKNAALAFNAFGYLVLALLVLLVAQFGIQVVADAMNVGVDFLVRLASFL